jgi:hypothetical protein
VAKATLVEMFAMGDLWKVWKAREMMGRYQRNQQRRGTGRKRRQIRTYSIATEKEGEIARSSPETHWLEQEGWVQTRPGVWKSPQTIAREKAKTGESPSLGHLRHLRRTEEREIEKQGPSRRIAYTPEALQRLRGAYRQAQEMKFLREQQRQEFLPVPVTGHTPLVVPPVQGGRRGHLRLTPGHILAQERMQE